MVDASCALYRLDFCTDLTAAQAPVITIGFMLEAAVHRGGRWLGLASRKSLTVVEMDHVNLQTWPELENLDHYMGEIFERCWSYVAAADSGDICLGSLKVSESFSAMSALHFCKLDVPAELVVALQGESNAWQTAYYGKLLSLGDLLKPTLTAEVLAFEMPAPTPVVAPECRPTWRLEAA